MGTNRALEICFEPVVARISPTGVEGAAIRDRGGGTIKMTQQRKTRRDQKKHIGGSFKESKEPGFYFGMK